jgi:serine/threonine-protein kinase
MSPEQLRSTQSVDRRTDLWSLGVVMFELLTGTSAYSPEGTLSEVIVTILEQPPPRVMAFRPDIPPALDGIVDRCLQRDLNQRFQNAAELAIALLPLAPKGARTKVERAIAVTRAAGLAQGRLALLDSDAPPPKSAEISGPFSGPFSGPLSGPFSGPVSASPLSASSPGPPSFTPGQGTSTGPNPGVSSLADTSPFGAPPHPPVAVTSGSSGARQTGRAVTIASAGIAALLCAGVFAWVARRGPSPADKGHADLPTTASSAGGVAAGVVAPSEPTAPATVTPPSVPAEGGAGEMPAPSAHAADANAAQAPAAPSKKRPAAAPPASHADAGPSAPAAKDLDIRMQR